MYYDYNRILSYNAMINFLIGERRCWKNLSEHQNLLLINFWKNGEEFAYIRRYKPELSEAVPKFFSALNSNNEFEGHHLYNKRKYF